MKKRIILVATIIFFGLALSSCKVTDKIKDKFKKDVSTTETTTTEAK